MARSIIEEGALRIVATARLAAADAEIGDDQVALAMTALILAGLSVVLQSAAAPRERLLALCRGWLADEEADSPPAL